MRRARARAYQLYSINILNARTWHWQNEIEIEIKNNEQHDETHTVRAIEYWIVLLIECAFGTASEHSPVQPVRES